jgi:hypothetical protein
MQRIIQKKLLPRERKRMLKKLLLCTAIVLSLGAEQAPDKENIRPVNYNYLDLMQDYLDVLKSKPDAVELRFEVRCSCCGHYNNLWLLLSN